MTEITARGMMVSSKTLLSISAALLFAGAAGGCASNQPANSRGLTGSITKPATMAARDDEDESARPVPADPYKGVQYKGGRDPVTGVAPDLDGQMPPPADAKPARKTAARTNVAIKTSAGAANTATASGLRVQVQAGDTLASLARKHNVTVAALMQVNGLASPKIVVAQTLVIPAK